MVAYPMEPCTIEMGSRTLRFTMVNANHCSGAVMFLFECDGKAVLYTGDTRAEEWFVNSLEQNPSLMPYMKGFRQLDNIYVDATFSYRLDHRYQNHYITFPTNRDGTLELLKELEKYPAHTKFYFATTNVMGFEDVWLMIYHKFNEQVYMNKHHWEIFNAIAPHSQWGRELLRCLTCDPSSRFHGTCDRFCRCYETHHRVRVVPVTNKTSVAIQQDAQPIDLNNEFMTKIVDEPFSVYYYNHPEPSYTENDPNKYYVLSKDGSCYLRTSIEFQYSRHSSKEEMVHLVSIFHPKTVHPFTATATDYLKGFKMEPIFGHVCDSGEFAFDIAMANNEEVAVKNTILGHEGDKLIKAAGKKLRGEVCDYSALSSNESDTNEDSDEIHQMLAEDGRRRKQEKSLASKPNTEEKTKPTIPEQQQASNSATMIRPEPNNVLSSPQMHENNEKINCPQENVCEQTLEIEKDSQRLLQAGSLKRQRDDDLDITKQLCKNARLQELHTNTVLTRRTKTVTEKQSSRLFEKLSMSCPQFFGKLFKSNNTDKDEEDNFHLEKILKLRNKFVKDDGSWFKMSFDFEKS
ncbi:hypothetical protein TRICI_001136 [Trichomonascus ciferrii]|uniref:DNA repair metallo-beta-lactamase domain-containing protein n=1 Tax=Trichomonascus ciferrii TaxID=44093 RepID=A0A642V996_9ASCO|nr:hypothetical protein TRICI_001136 [Trichomonascus ciferrii]